VQTFDHFIGNEYVAPASRIYAEVFEPATGAAYARVAMGDASDVNAGVAAAERAFPGWSATPVAERARLISRLADLIDANVERLAQAESVDTGKPIALARGLDVPRSATNFRYFAHAVQHAPGELFETDQQPIGGPLRAINYTLRRPRGVAGLISPWNLPLYLLTWKIAPAIATGNTCVAKPSEVTPASATLLGELIREAGIPGGVINILHGGGATCGSELVKHASVPAVSFTGSTGVGRWIGETCGRMLKRVSLELGGKNPFIVFDDADVDGAIGTAVRAAFTNQGQICLCGSRLLVHERVAERVLAGVIAGAKSLRVGDPADVGTQFGAMVSREHMAKVAGMVDEARRDGGVVHTGGAPVSAERLPARCRGGYFYEPTVITGLPPACRAVQEEIFGPVVTVQTFRDEDEAVALANSTSYGLAAVVYSQDVSRAHRVADRLASGVVWVNCWMVRDLRTPFGGARASGVGREGGLEAIRFFTEPKNVCLKV